MEEKGERRTFWMQNNLDALVEETRTKLGMSKSGFYRYAVIRLLQEMSVLSTKVKEDQERPMLKEAPASE